MPKISEDRVIKIQLPIGSSKTELFNTIAEANNWQEYII